MIQWLRFHASNSGHLGLIPSQGAEFNMTLSKLQETGKAGVL